MTQRTFTHAELERMASATAASAAAIASPGPGAIPRLRLGAGRRYRRIPGCRGARSAAGAAPGEAVARSLRRCSSQ
jgi:hypothetical protein